MPPNKHTLLVLLASSFHIHAATTWDAADDNISGGSFLDINSFFLDVSDTSGPAIGDGFELNLSSAGGNIDLNINAGGTAARFFITVPTGVTTVSAITFDVNFDHFGFALNPAGSPAQREALAYLSWAGGDDIRGDLSFKDLIVTPDNPRLTFARNDSAWLGGGDFLLDPEDDSAPGFQRYTGVHTLVEGSSDPTHKGFTLTVRTDDGGNFTPGTSFIVTFDAGFNPVPEPSALLLTTLRFS